MSSITYSSNGTYSWTVPTGVTSVTISVAGAGGGGGGTDGVEHSIGQDDGATNGSDGGASSIIRNGVTLALAAAGLGGILNTDDMGTPSTVGTGDSYAGLSLTISGGSTGGAGDPNDYGEGVGQDGGNGNLVAGTLTVTATQVLNITVGAGGVAGNDPYSGPWGDAGDQAAGYGVDGVVTLTWTAGGGSSTVHFRHYEIW